MSNSSKKISDLTSVTTLASTDKVVVLTNPGTTANVQTITLGNMVNNLSAANVATLSTTSIISPAGSGANIVIDPDGTADVIFTTATEVFINSVLGTTSPTTGALVVAGGVGANSVWVNNYVTVGNSSANAVIGWNTNDLSVAEFAGSQNNYVEIAVYNSTTGPAASGDFSVNDNLGVNANNYIDMGINSTNWSNTLWTINGPSDGYLYTGNTNLSIGTANNAYINFFTGGTLITNERMRITNTGNVGIGTTTPGYKLDITGDVRASANLYVAAVNVGANLVVNTTSISVGNSLSTFSSNSTSISVGNSTVNTFSNSTHFYSGNSTVYGLGNNTSESLVYAGSGNLVMTATNFVISNTTSAVVTANLAGITLGASANVSIPSNTGLVLGTGSLATSANGFTYLPNGLLMNWGVFAANSSTTTNAIFAKAFTTAVFSVTTTSVAGAFYTYLAANAALSNVAIRSSSTTTASDVQFIAIGY